MAVDPNTGTVYVTNEGSNPGTVSVISEATDTVTNTIAVGSNPLGVAVDPNTGTVYVTKSTSSTVSVISEASDTVTNTVTVGATPIGVAVDPNTDTMYVANFAGDTVSVIRQTPAVSAVSPNAGALKGSTAVTITGSGFVSGATVKIGQGAHAAIAATDVVFVSSTKITAMT